MADMTCLFLGTMILLVALFLTVIVMLHKRKKYFEEQGIPYLNPNLKKMMGFFCGSLSIIDLEQETYQEVANVSSPVVGVSEIFGQPVFMVNDLTLAKRILIKDFDHFINRRPFEIQQSNRWFKRMIFFLEDEKWKGTRARLSPSFTTGRIRTMFHIFKASSDRQVAYLKEQMTSPSALEAGGLDVDVMHPLTKFSMDVIANAVFGSGGGPTFEKHCLNAGFQFTPKKLALFILIMAAPKLADLFAFDVFDKEAQTYFASILAQVIKRRRETGERCQDFLQLMLDAQQGLLQADEETSQVMNGTMNDPGKGSHQKSGVKPGTFTDDDITANAIMFLIGGFETVLGVPLFLFYRLALQPEIQDKLYQEVVTVLDQYEGELKYEAIAELKYLDMVVSECLRMYPPSIRLERYCAKDYPVPGTNMILKKNSIVTFSVLGMHHNPEYFPEPEKFLPERFSPENKGLMTRDAYLPFGIGQRNCIGMRFSLIEIKTVIIQLVRSFYFSPCAKTNIPLEFATRAALTPKGGMWLRLTVRGD